MICFLILPACNALFKLSGTWGPVTPGTSLFSANNFDIANSFVIVCGKLYASAAFLALVFASSSPFKGSLDEIFWAFL